MYQTIHTRLRTARTRDNRETARNGTKWRKMAHIEQRKKPETHVHALPRLYSVPRDPAKP